MANLTSGLVLFLAMAICVGCGGGTSSGLVDRRQQAQQYFDQGQEDFDNGDFQSAREHFDQAITGGGLHPDIYTEAHIMRAVCAAHESDFAAAHEDLDKMEQGAPDPDRIFAARSFVFAKEGKMNESRNLWNQARRINPRVRQFE